MTQFVNRKISWSQFEVSNPNVQEAFENMCRCLFSKWFFDEKTLEHSDPNNPGVEVVPILYAESNKHISFQAKYFKTKVGYTQIEDSADAAIKHYEGKLDVIYLYCNKDIQSTSRQYKKIEDKLAAHGIEIIPITGRTILDQVEKNPTIAWYYFNEISLTQDWFKKHVNNGLLLLGPKYNHNFNVETRTEKLLQYFLCTEDAVTEINQQKKDVLNKLFKDYCNIKECSSLLSAFVNAICTLDDITMYNISDCLQWGDKVKALCEKELVDVKKIIETKLIERKVAYEKQDLNLRSKLTKEIDLLSYLENISQNILPEQYPRSLLKHQCLILTGNAGMGKSQLIATTAEKMVRSGNAVILLLGSQFLSSHTINTQITEILDLDLTLEALLHKLEGEAVQADKLSYIFIDALNESVDRSIWEIGLSSLLSKLKEFPHIKLILTVRSGYEKLVFNENILNLFENGDVARITHHGFIDNSIEATTAFLDFYGIPFLPSYFLQTEMTNPLFLTLFCKTFSGSRENFDMFSLFEKLISKSDKEAQKAVGIEDYMPVLQQLIYEIASIRLKKGFLQVTQQDLFKLDFWKTYGFESNKIKFIRSLERSQLLNSMVIEGTELYSLGYNLLEDFVCAKTILKEYTDKENLIRYMCEDLLQIQDGQIVNSANIDIFVIVCALYAEKEHMECFTDIELQIKDDIDKNTIAHKYLESFLWRKASSVGKKEFVEFVNKRPIDVNLFFRILIENSTKEQHPLNANFLHEFLLDQELVKRDAFWTAHINGLSYEDERVFQLIKFFDEGSMLNGLSKANTELLLTLLVWLFASSNRVLRDKASKAAIELLRYNFELCKPLLQRFETVNDPYVFQRIYGVVFGACMKRIEEKMDVFDELADYIYEYFFNQNFVYPDVLARDYARLIIERWFFENPKENQKYNREVVTPPYHSHTIPIVQPETYYNPDNLGSGYNRIARSMQIDHAECPGLYGDFGRYTFQAALKCFKNVDVVNLYHYAMQYIRDDLGYNDDMLGDYDQTPQHYRFTRNDTKKVERIGKKYQWITLYNILARISDSHQLKDWESNSYSYEGPWDPYVRDFDPTLNINTFKMLDVPQIEFPYLQGKFLPEDSVNSVDILQWVKEKPDIFNLIPSRLQLMDNKKCSWIALNMHDIIKNKRYDESLKSSVGFKKGSQEIWMLSEAYLVKAEDFDYINNQDNQSSIYDELPEASLVYQLFNREYTWSPGYKSTFKQKWTDVEVSVGEDKIIKEKVKIADYTNLHYDEDGNISIPVVERELEKRVRVGIRKMQVMPAYSRVLWEEQYDASQDQATAFNIPCGDIIEVLDLKQKQADGSYYTNEGTLVCFDGSIAGLREGLLIRQDYLEKYLKDTGLKIFWKCIGGKQYFTGDLSQEWSDWGGLFTLANSEIVGELKIK